MHTLDDSPVVWDRTLAANDGADSCHSSRFLCVFGSAAVLDRETGLVWQRTPPSGTEAWTAAINDCMNAPVAGRYGWRIPRIEEFQSLQTLPAGHPFTNLQPSSQYYWSSTTYPDNSVAAYVAGFGAGEASPVNTGGKTASNEHVWCVRGGAGLDGQ